MRKNNQRDSESQNHSPRIIEVLDSDKKVEDSGGGVSRSHFVDNDYRKPILIDLEGKKDCHHGNSRSNLHRPKHNCQHQSSDEQTSRFLSSSSSSRRTSISSTGLFIPHKSMVADKINSSSHRSNSRRSETKRIVKTPLEKSPRGCGSNEKSQQGRPLEQSSRIQVAIENPRGRPHLEKRNSPQGQPPYENNHRRPPSLEKRTEQISEDK